MIKIDPDKYYTVDGKGKIRIKNVGNRGNQILIKFLEKGKLRTSTYDKEDIAFVNPDSLQEWVEPEKKNEDKKVRNTKGLSTNDLYEIINDD